MKKHAAQQKILFLAVITILVTAGCSTQRNTERSRWWHGFTTRYNVYYNATQAYISGSLAKEQGNRDDYTDFLPLYTVGNDASRMLGASDYDRSIEKCRKALQLHSIKKRPQWNKNRRKTDKDREWLNRKEYNPFLWKAWLLLGRSQFMKGNFDDAAATFAYTARLYSTQPAVYCKAKAWLARCYIYSDRLYEAEDLVVKAQRDSLHWASVREWDYTFADFYLHKKLYEKSIPYLRKAISHEVRRKQRARMWYLLGQAETSIGHRNEACQAFKHVIRLHPPYELALHARISQTEVMASAGGEKIINRLLRMARQESNKNYTAQIYYAVGSAYLTCRDTTRAVAAYEKGRNDSLDNSNGKGILLVRLGDIYWNREQYMRSDSCYSEALPLVGKDFRDYKRLLRRVEVLKMFNPQMEIVRQADAVQSAPAASRNGNSGNITPQKSGENRRKLAEALFNAGVVAKDKMDNYALGEKLLRRLNNDFADYGRRDEALYHLFLLGLRKGNAEQTDSCLTTLRNDFPDSKWTSLLSDPDYQFHAKFGTHTEDSLYAATYNAFKAGKYKEVDANAALSAARFPMGLNRDKFLFIGGMSKLNSGNAKACVNDMQTLIANYPESEVREMAIMIVKGINSGRQTYMSDGGIDDVWERRTLAAAGRDSTSLTPLKAERNTDFAVLMVYNPDSVNQNKLLFELARYNFTNFLVRSFSIKTDTLGGLSRIRVDGFHSYDEALQYARLLHNDENVMREAARCRTVIISRDNLPLLGTQHSYKDYEVFFEKNFGNIPVSRERLLDNPETIEYLPQDKSQEATPQNDTDSSETEVETDDGTGTDDEYYDLEGF